MLASINYVDVLKSASGVELMVLILLAAASAYSWALIAMKSMQLRKARAESVTFLDTFWKASRLDAIYQTSQQLEASPLSRVFRAGYEELSKLWSVFFQSQYVLSLACQASVVVIDGDQTPAFTRTVAARDVFSLPPGAPVITEVRDEDASRPVTASSTLRIAGERLLGEGTRVRVGGVEVAPTFATEREVAVPLALPALSALGAGVHGVQVLHRPREAGGRELVVESNQLPLIIHPVLVGVSAVTATPAGDLYDVAMSLDISPAPSAGRSVWLVLFGAGGGDLPTYAARASGGGPWAVTVRGVRPGLYEARVRVDGVDSVRAETRVDVPVP